MFIINNIITINMLISMTIINNVFASYSQNPYIMICAISCIYTMYVNMIMILPIIIFSIIIYNSTIINKRYDILLSFCFTLLCLYFAIFVNHRYDIVIDKILVCIYTLIKIYSSYLNKNNNIVMLPFIFNINMNNENSIYDNTIIYFLIVYIYIMILKLFY
jgi:hypothetical protein